jgi:Ca2+:H+ antiporter
MAVHHAEVIAHRVGEPFGTLVLAVSVTVIEVGLILALMVGDASATTLARDTVFAAVMIVANLVVGLSVVVGALKHRLLQFSNDATSGLLATLVLLAGVTLVLPRFTSSTPGPTYSTAQLVFAAICAVGVYAVFVLVQTVLDRDVYVAEAGTERRAGHTGPLAGFAFTFTMLALCLVAVVGLAKTSSGAIKDFVHDIGATPALEGVILALLVLLPETLAAIKAAYRNELQTTMNLALGSGIASIGLTIPAVALATIWIDTPLVLGLGSKELVLLAFTFVLAAITLSRGRATVLNGAIHVVVALIFVFLTIEP